MVHRATPPVPALGVRDVSSTRLALGTPFATGGGGGATWVRLAHGRGDRHDEDDEGLGDLFVGGRRRRVRDVRSGRRARHAQRAGRESGERLRFRRSGALAVQRRAVVQHDAHAGRRITGRQGEGLDRDHQRGAAVAGRRHGHGPHRSAAADRATECLLVRDGAALRLGPEQGRQQRAPGPEGADRQAAEPVLLRSTTPCRRRW